MTMRLKNCVRMLRLSCLNKESIMACKGSGKKKK